MSQPTVSRWERFADMVPHQPRGTQASDRVIQNLSISDIPVSSDYAVSCGTPPKTTFGGIWLIPKKKISITLLEYAEPLINVLEDDYTQSDLEGVLQQAT
jgi:hypothetical protein